MPWHLYILLCADNRYYIGTTEDLPQRIHDHNHGKGTPYTLSRSPVRLVYSESHDSHASALARERQLKRWSRANKEALIVGDLARLKALSKSGDA